jgi:hypothetical protein
VSGRRRQANNGRTLERLAQIKQFVEFALGPNRDAKATRESPSKLERFSIGRLRPAPITPVSVDAASKQACSPDHGYAAPIARAVGPLLGHRRTRARFSRSFGKPKLLVSQGETGARGMRTLVAGYPTNRISRKLTRPDRARPRPPPEYKSDS